MLYKEFEKLVSDMLNSIRKPKEVLIPCGRNELDLCKAEIKYKDGHIVASWRKENSSWGTEAHFFQDAASGEAKVRWSEVAYININLAN